ncbi:MAG: two-component regulator propeller domain-containing protein [Rhodothermales bacterium]
MRIPTAPALLLLWFSAAFGSTYVHAQHSEPRLDRASSSRSDTPPTSIRFERLLASDGLSSQVVYSALQDRRGYMWFATWSGLSRYDGYTVEHFKAIPFDSTSIATNTIWTVYEDRSGYIWAGGGQGVLSRMDPVTGTFTNVRRVPGDSSRFTLGGIWRIHEDRTGHLWVGTLDGIYRRNPETRRFSHFEHDPVEPRSLSHNVVRDIHESEDGDLWVSTANGLNLFDPATESWTRYLHASVPLDQSVHNPSVSAQDPSHVFVDIYGDPSDPDVLWLSSGYGLIRFSPTSGEHERFLPDANDEAANRVSMVAPDPGDADILWIATHGGLYRFHRPSGHFTGYHHNPSDATSLSADLLTCVYTDRTGIVWVCAQEFGVNRFDPASAAVDHYRQIPGSRGSLPDDAVAAIYEDTDDRLWAGLWASEGLVRIDRETNEVQQWPLSFVKAIFEDRSGRLWAASRDAGLHYFDRDRESFRIHPSHAPPGGFDSRDIWVITQDSDGILWAGSAGNGLHRIDPETDRVRSYLHDPDDPQSISDDYVVEIVEDHAGQLWLGTWRGGLNRMDRETGIFERYEYDPAIPEGLSSNAVWVFLEREVEPGVLWIGTDGGGLSRLDTRTERFTHYTTEDGLADNAVWGLAEDADGRLWISTSRGLSRFDPEEVTFRTYTDRRLQSTEFKDEAYFQSRSGELFFGGVNGFNAFFPSDMKDNPHPPQVTLTEMRLFNEPVAAGDDARLQRPIWMTEEVRLMHDENSVSFDFVALHYRNPTENRYAYKLDGFDADWVDDAPTRTATYTNLSPGTYTFRVRATNSDGVWNEEGASVRLVVLPPWWRTMWAYAAYGILLVGGVFAVHRFQHRRVVRKERARAQIEAAQLKAETAEARSRAFRAENERNELELERARQLKVMNERLEEKATLLMEMDRTKARFFANISHEFRTPMALILGPLQDALDRGDGNGLSRHDLAMMHSNGRRLLRLINQLLDLSRVETGSMNLEARQADLVGFLRQTVLAFSARAEKEGVMLSFHADEQKLAVYFDGDKIEKVVFNLVWNALKFTGAGGKVHLAVASEGTDGHGYAVVRVKDTGPGIPADKLPFVFDRFYQVDGSSTRVHEGTGIGLALARELIELHRGKISVQSEIGFGTTFEFRLPLGKDHLVPDEIVDEPRDAVEAAALDVEGPFSMADGDVFAPTVDDDATQRDETTEPDPPDDAPLILVVDDNADVRSYLRTRLHAHYRTEEASDGKEGLERTRRLRPDLVITDVMMPELDGFELCSAIKADPELNHIPVIILTAKADEESKIAGLELGADDYLMKPFSAEELLSRAENLIEVRRMLRQRFSDEVRIGPSDLSVPSADAAFLKRVRETFEAHIDDSNFGVARLAEEVGLSPRHFHRRMKALTQLSPTGYIRMMRLERAAQLLDQRAGNVSEVAVSVGYNDASYFARLFKQSFGVTPSEFSADSE